MDIESKIQSFADTVRADQTAWYAKEYPNLPAPVVSVKPGKKYVKVDVGSSGRYMIDLATLEIFGIKAYGVIHRGHAFGTLDTVAEWNWGGYRAWKKVAVNP